MTLIAARRTRSTELTHRHDTRIWRSRLTPYVFVSPFYLIFMVFGLLPAIFSLVVSLYDWHGLRFGGFAGLQNYIILFQDPDFYTALRNTAYIWVGSVPTMAFSALVLAVLVNNRLVRLRGFFRTIYFLPVVTSLVVTGLLFSQLFSSSYGLVNRILVMVHLHPINWLADPHWMRLTLILALLWRWTGNDMVIMLAGLQSIPGDLYEAAEMDGASKVQTFWRITVPMMAPMIVFDLIISTIGTFNLFAEPYALFGKNPIGGVGGAGQVMGTFLYEQGFVYFKFGYSAAIAWIIALIVFALSMVQLRIGNRWSN